MGNIYIREKYTHTHKHTVKQLTELRVPTTQGKHYSLMMIMGNAHQEAHPGHLLIPEETSNLNLHGSSFSVYFPRPKIFLKF